MSEYLWTETRLRAIELFRDGPSAVIEQRVLDVFRDHPSLVAEGIEHIGRRFEAGKIRNPWVILAKHVEEAVRPLEDVHATDERDRVKAVARAEQWIRATGQHFDREEEVLEELFGEFGRLKTWREDEPLKVRMLALWGEVRPKGELIAKQELERAVQWRSTTGLRFKLERDSQFRAAYLAEHPELEPAPAAEPALEEDPEPVLDDPEPVIA